MSRYAEVREKVAERVARIAIVRGPVFHKDVKTMISASLKDADLMFAGASGRGARIGRMRHFYSGELRVPMFAALRPQADRAGDVETSLPAPVTQKDLQMARVAAEMPPKASEPKPSKSAVDRAIELGSKTNEELVFILDAGFSGHGMTPESNRLALLRMVMEATA